MGDRATRDAEFSAYMEARQASLMRTAYLISGDRHTAEDLVQTALAKLYLVGTGSRTAGPSTATCAA